MRKFRRNYFVVPILTVIIVITAQVHISALPNAPIYHLPVYDYAAIADTVKPATDTVKRDDSTGFLKDTGIKPRVDTFSLKLSKDSLSAPVEYSAQDSAVGMMEEKTITLYGKAKTDYQDVSLKAPVIELDQSRNLITAQSGKDSTGEISDYAEMKQGDSQFKSESMQYNFKTMQGLTKNTITQQGEMFVHAEIVKKIDERTMYGKGNFFTTCNLDHPHFGFRAERAKIINKKLAVTGTVRPEFDSVPIPIFLPFGFYPLSQGRHSGILSPSFETNDQMGLGLSGLGYYYAINDYWDVQVRGDFYSYGSWRFNVSPTYRKIYKYQGSLNFGMQKNRYNFKGDPDYSNLNTFSLQWGHSSDMRARPGTSFSANVNASSTKYNENVPNSNVTNFSNTMGSSITYSKNWQGRPFNLSVSANHNQVNVSRTTTINFPNISFNVNTLYPLQRKEAVGTKKWYEQLGIGYTGSFTNSVAFYDTTTAILKRMLDTLRWGASHSIPISLSLPPILNGAVMVSPSVSYSQDWVDRRTKFHYQRINNRDTVLPTIERGFFIKQRASFGLGFSTALYGTFRLKNSSAMRHVIRPTMGVSYTPDLTRSEWDKVRIDSFGTEVLYNKLDGSAYLNRSMSQFVSRQFGGMNFGFDNTLELKKRIRKKKKDDVDSTKSPSAGGEQSDFKKIRLIEGFGFNTSYNLFADSMQLAPLNFYFRTNLFEKIQVTSSATLVPYVLNGAGYATRKYAWQGDRFGIGKIINASISISTSFQSKPKDPEKDKRRQEAINKSLNDPMLQAQQQQLLEYARQNPAEFVDFNTPWSVSLSMSVQYNRGTYDSARHKWQSTITSSPMFNGSFNLTPKWNFSVNGAYDFATMKVQTFSMAISRDLHCWQLAINVTPVGMYRYFNFTISPKAGILQDLKINRTRSFRQ